MKLCFLLSLYLFSILSFASDECSHYYKSNGSFIQRMWEELASKTRTKNDINITDFLKAKEKLLAGKRLDLTNTNEKLAYLNVIADRENSNLTTLIESFSELSPTTQKELWRIPNRIIDSKGRVVQKNTEKYLAKFYEVYYKVPNASKTRFGKLEEFFAKQIQRDLAVSRLEKSATIEERLKTRNFLSKSLNRLFSNTRFQVVTNVSFNLSVMNSLIGQGVGLPYFGKINFYKIGPKVIEDALLFDLNYAVKTHFPNFKNKVKFQIIYDSLRGVVNKVAVGAFVIGGLYKVIDEAYLTEEEKKQLEIKGSILVDEQIESLEEEQKKFSKEVKSIDSRDMLFKLFLIKHQKESGRELVPEDTEFKDYWLQVYEASYPEKKNLSY